MMNDDLYEPREDSFLLAEQVKKYARGKVLDMCTGSGIQAVAAAKKKSVTSVLAVDINKKALAYAHKKNHHKKITFLRSDLFSNVKETFDTIICNPPYLPNEPKLKDIALDGGRHGYEFTARFLNEAGPFLAKNGIILLVFSSLTNKPTVNDVIAKKGFVFNQLASQKFDYEGLFVYKLSYPPFVQQLYDRGITTLKMFAHGHRGLIFTGLLKNKKVAVKIQRPDTAAKGTVAREAAVLKQLNPYRIGPRLLLSGKNYFVYEFVEGPFIRDFIKSEKQAAIKKMLIDVFCQMKKLDELGLNKEEMHHPFKHVIIAKHKPVLLDFERCKKTAKAHNVTQFCECVARMMPELTSRGVRVTAEKMRGFAVAYRRNPTVFKKVILYQKSAQVENRVL